MPPANVEGKVASHALSVVFQRCTVAFVGWASWGSSFCGNTARMSAMDVIVWVGAVQP